MRLWYAKECTISQINPHRDARRFYTLWLRRFSMHILALHRRTPETSWMIDACNSIICYRFVFSLECAWVAVTGWWGKHFSQEIQIADSCKHLGSQLCQTGKDRNPCGDCTVRYRRHCACPLTFQTIMVLLSKNNQTYIKHILVFEIILGDFLLVDEELLRLDACHPAGVSATKLMMLMAWHRML